MIKPTLGQVVERLDDGDNVHVLTAFLGHLQSVHNGLTVSSDGSHLSILMTSATLRPPFNTAKRALKRSSSSLGPCGHSITSTSMSFKPYHSVHGTGSSSSTG